MTQLRNGRPERDHDSVRNIFTKFLPANHPNIDNKIENNSPNRFPSNHPDLYKVCDANLVDVYGGHTDIDAALRARTKPPSTHKKIDPSLRPMAPTTHPNMDDLMAQGAALPANHPPIEVWMKRAPTPPPTALSAACQTPYQATELAKHSTQSDCFVYINNNVYDLTRISARIQALHKLSSRSTPQTIIPYCGKDASRIFAETTSHSSKQPYSPLMVAAGVKCVGGKLQGTIPTPAPVKPTPLPAECTSPFPAANLAQHNTQTDCWVALEGYVNTEYMKIHPGQQQPIIKVCGTDSTTAFNNVASHSAKNPFKGGVGVCKGKVEGTPPPSIPPTSSPTSSICQQDYSAATLAQQNTQSSCVLALNGHVYDLTGYIDGHPGSKATILPHCGSDATDAYNAVASHTKKPYSPANPDLAILCVGGKVTGVLTTKSPTTTPPTPKLSTIDGAEVIKHANPADCWVVIDNVAYDLTTYAGQHPGGDSIIFYYCGKDATGAFNNQAAHSAKVPFGGGSQFKPKGKITGTVPPLAPTPLPQMPDVSGIEVATHNTINDCWVAIDGIAYELTQYALQHPGGKNTIYSWCGKDGTTAFNNVGSHATKPFRGGSSFRPQGKVTGDIPAQTPTPQPSLPDIDGKAVSTHSTTSDCWIVFNGIAYDMTEYILQHPGGTISIAQWCGKDGTAAFDKITAHTVRPFRGGAIYNPKGKVNTPIPTIPPTPSNLPSVTGEEVATHNTPNDCWVVLDGIAFDLTEYAPEHPAGRQVVLFWCGKDASAVFNRQIAHTTKPFIGGTIYKPQGKVNSTIPPSTANDTLITGADVAKKNGLLGACWIVIDGYVYDFSQYLSPSTFSPNSMHPAGNVVVLHWCGKDGSAAFNKVTKHKSLLPYTTGSSGFKVGKLDGKLPAPSPTPGPEISADKVATQDGTACLVVIDGFVYDFTAYAKSAFHPAGSQIILDYCGIDASEIFNLQPGHKKYLPYASGGSGFGLGKLSASTVLVAKARPVITIDELKKHNTKDDCWIVMGEEGTRVYDYSASVFEGIRVHAEISDSGDEPHVGSSPFRAYCGDNGWDAFNQQSAHVKFFPDSGRWIRDLNEPYLRTMPLLSAGQLVITFASTIFLLAAALRWGKKIFKCGKAAAHKEQIKQMSVNFKLSPEDVSKLQLEKGASIGLKEIKTSSSAPTAATFASDTKSWYDNPLDEDTWGCSAQTRAGYVVPRRPTSASTASAKVPPIPIAGLTQRKGPPPPPGRDKTLSLSHQLHKQHKAKEALYDAPEYAQMGDAPLSTDPMMKDVAVQKFMADFISQKKNSAFHSCMSALLEKRVSGSQYTYGHVLGMVLFVGFNIFFLIIGKNGHDGSELFAASWGSLAAASALLLVLPATHNSILTWVLGLPFDHVIIVHRWLGRWAIFCAMLHMATFFAIKENYATFLVKLQDEYETGGQFEMIAGIFAGLCGLIIFFTSLDFMRRKHFNIFFWSHFSFLGFFVGGALHVPQARPFVIASACFYGLDRLLRFVWGLLPSRCHVFEPKNDGGLTRLRFKKNVLKKLLRSYKVGQYMFVNFPEISLTEWHPFSVSSGPRELDLELHIRKLGDHTSLVCALAQECERTGRPLPYIRADGPYGVHDFNFRRYPVLLLAGGGVGITPVMGMIKDVFNVGRYSPEQMRQVVPHTIEACHMVWVMRAESEFETFRSTIEACMNNAQLPQFPKLFVWCYVSRPKVDLATISPVLIKGRPDFPEIFSKISQDYQSKASLVFACGPSPMVNQMWDLSSSKSNEGARFDFHHETFEF
eukprot:CAMPEP_0175176190 /NCGR_PEP_ID=MMETSP0087-20121206/33659_1 /TAXON_ID=136419 /ORGANISM="Unknown Unknown, Strain D1" /LENGTH=1777 /DNA_ID=CAMNT_0016467961 /DNA_START=123 /DNA_END=5458 /DNA_ORIENTATION=+